MAGRDIEGGNEALTNAPAAPAGRKIAVLMASYFTESDMDLRSE
jgi:hypothetical protein